MATARNSKLIERNLILGKWHPIDSSNDEDKLSTLAKDVVEGRFKDVLLMPESKGIFTYEKASGEGNGLLEDIKVSKIGDGDETLRLLVGIACLHAFVQANWTGPDLDVTPHDILPISSNDIPPDALNTLAVNALSSGGEPAYHLAQHATFLWLSQQIFATVSSPTAAWWRFRSHLVHQQVLDEPVSPPEGLLESLLALQTLYVDDAEMRGRLFLEAGLLDHHVRADKKAGEQFVHAVRSTGLQYELTGALGKRTKFQVNELSQLVLLAQSALVDEGAKEVPQSENQVALSTELPKTLELNDDTLLEQTAFTSSQPASSTPSLLQSIDPGNQPALHPLDQCILLALCLNVRNTSPSHGLTHEQMAPNVHRVLSHPRNWSVHTMALLLRSRLEANRTRTVERAVLQIQALVDQMPTADSTVQERLRCIHAIALPSKWALEKELALALLSIGAVKSALEIFERLEMWEDVAKCYVSVERADQARAVIRDLLEGRKVEADTVLARGKSVRSTSMDEKREAKLWCILGDLEPENAVQNYTHAWELSAHTSGRAMRSLGGYHFARAEYAEAITCLSEAVKINPLLARSWFVLGCAAMRLERYDEAKVAFGRCVAIDEEDGESWSNLASMYLRTGASTEPIEKAAPLDDEEDDIAEIVPTSEGGIPFSNKLLAFRALKEGLKHCNDNWRMWSNYMIVSIDVGELFEAARALGQLVKLAPSKSTSSDSNSPVLVDEDVLERLVGAALKVKRTDDEEDEAEAAAGGADGMRQVKTGEALIRTMNALFESTILPRTSSPRIQRAYARLLISQKRYSDGVRAYIDEYRASEQARGDINDSKAFGEAAEDVSELVDVLRNFGPRAEEEQEAESGDVAFKWKLQARSIVRTFLGKHRRDFEDEPAYEKLKELLDELKA